MGLGEEGNSIVVAGNSDSGVCRHTLLDLPGRFFRLHFSLSNFY